MPKELPPIDDDIHAALQEFAEPLVDDYNTVLRKVIDLARQARSNGAEAVAGRTVMVLKGTKGIDPRGKWGANQGKPLPTVSPQIAASTPEPAPKSLRKKHRATARQAKRMRSSKSRAPRGSLLPEREYEVPLLQSLAEMGGSAHSGAAIERVGEKVADRLTDIDREVIDSGLVRWKNRVQFVRLGLMKSGDMVAGSQRGVWTISDQGRKRIEAEG
jgi:hypothetical protein